MLKQTRWGVSEFNHGEKYSIFPNNNNVKVILDFEKNQRHGPTDTQVMGMDMDGRCPP